MSRTPISRLRRFSRYAVTPLQPRWAGALLTDQRGISVVERTIVVIAFVAFVSVFAYAVKSTGLLDPADSETGASETADAGQIAFQFRGPVAAYASTTETTIDRIVVPVFITGGDSFDLTGKRMVVTYFDKTQILDLDFNPRAGDIPGSQGWVITVRATEIGTGRKRADISLNLTGLKNLLGPSSDFSIQVKPDDGDMLEVKRTTPREIRAVMNLS